ncbi:MAG: GNAT family N-acetyltransferase [Candidatus Thermoplasmatota archaeon]|nr:GNAT family N-acetyltransferase [Candidatus Thermoplasmatota archaeon]
MAADGKEIRVEQLSEGQLDALIEAQNRIFEDYIIQIRSSRQFFMDFLRSVGGDLREVIVSMDGDQIVGYVCPVIDGDEAWIGGLGVLPSHRRRGIGTRLMLAAEEKCRSKGVREVTLEVIEGNDLAKRFYEKLGYAGSRRYLTAEGRPARFEGFGQMPEPATQAEIVRMHARSYADTCWQKRTVHAIMSSARGAERYKVDGGFVLLRVVETNAFIPFLGVLPEKRRTGVATSLTRFALNRLWNLGAFKVTVYNVNEDLPTLRLLDMFDFKVTMKEIEMKKNMAGK